MNHEAKKRRIEDPIRPSSKTVHLLQLEPHRATHPYGVPFAALFSDAGPLRRALITSYVVDIPFWYTFPFVSQQLDGAERVCVVADGGSNVHRMPVPKGNLRVVAPRTTGAMHHCKVMLLEFDRCLRVVVGTCNWTDDVSLRINLVWMHDCPRSTQPRSSDVGDECMEIMGEYLTLIGQSWWAERLVRFDWSEMAARLVFHRPGVHKGAAISKYGLGRLKALMEERRGTVPLLKSPALLAHTSSLGLLGSRWLQEFAEVAASVHEKDVSIFWPSRGFVRWSHRGWWAGGSLFSKKSTLDSKTLKPRLFQFLPQIEAFRKTTPHAKAYACFDTAATDPSRIPLDWFLLTSCNLSRGAWGEFQLKGTQLKISIFEMGVLLLPELSNGGLTGALKGEERVDGVDVPLVVNPIDRIPFFDDDPDGAPWARDQDHLDPDTRGKSFLANEGKRTVR